MRTECKFFSCFLSFNLTLSDRPPQEIDRQTRKKLDFEKTDLFSSVGALKGATEIDDINF